MASDEDSSESDTADDKRMSDIYFSSASKPIPMGTHPVLGEIDIDTIQRHASVHSNSNSESSFSLNDSTISLLKGQDPLCSSDTRDDIKSMDFMDVTSISPHVPSHDTRKLRTRSNDSSKSDFSEISLSEMAHIRASMSRRASGSLSPRLIEFKRRESLDSFESHEKSHEQETNELQTLNTKVEELIDRNSKTKICITDCPSSNSPKRTTCGKQVYIPSSSHACPSPTRNRRAQSPLTSVSSCSALKKRKLYDTSDEPQPKRASFTRIGMELRSGIRSSTGLDVNRRTLSYTSSTCSFDSEINSSSNSPHSHHSDHTDNEHFQAISQNQM